MIEDANPAPCRQGTRIITHWSLRDLGRSPAVMIAHGATADPARLLLNDFLDRQPLLAAINSVLAVLTALALAGTAPPAILLPWLAAMLLAQASRVALWLAVRINHPLTVRRLPWLLTLASALTGLVWGSAGIVLLRSDAPPASILVPFVLAGMSAGSITALPAHPPAFFVFIWAALAPYALKLAASPDGTSRAMAGITLLYAAGLSAVGWQVHRTLRRAAELHLQNATLVHRLDDAPGARGHGGDPDHGAAGHQRRASARGRGTPPL